MSQKKVDMRKKNRGDMIHDLKKQMKVTIAAVAVVLVAIGAIASVITYSTGYDNGKEEGVIEGYSAYEAYQKLLNSMTTTAGKGDEKETTKKDDEKETTKKGDEKETTKKDEDETTKADEKETTEKPTEESTEASDEK